ncbi:MAG TPA: PAS domain S-box protein [Alphaproteobacteria bacterium]|nr:PAS domain S-box protein [Alphaproteobacteria bacterium]
MSDTRGSVAILRRAAALFVPFAAVALAVTYLLYQSQAAAVRAGTDGAALRAVATVQQSFVQTLTVLVSDLVYITHQDTLQTWLARGDAESLRHLQNEHLAFARSRAAYDQIRMMDATGQEILRVQWRDGAALAAPSADLASMVDNPLFAAAIKLEHGQLLVSEFSGLDPSAAGNPELPSLCVAAPVFDQAGQKRGVVILKYRAQRLIDRLKSLPANALGAIWLVDHAGNWLIGPTAGTGSQGNEGAGASFAAAYPETWQQIDSGGASALLNAPAGRFAYAKILPADYHPRGTIPGVETLNVTGPAWIAIGHTPSNVLWGQTADLRRTVVLGTAVLLLLLGGVAWGLARQQLQRQESEQRIRLSEARFRDLVESAPDGVIIIDKDGRIELVNAQAERQFGYPRQELIGQTIEMLIPDRARQGHPERRESYIERARTRQMSPGMDIRGRRKDGSEFPISVSLSPTWSGGGPSIFCDIRDMTAQHETDRKIQELNRRLRQDNAELEALNRELETFSYSVSHDLRAPLRAIAGFAEAIGEESGDQLAAQSRSDLDRVRRAAERMELLIDDLLKLATVSRTEITKSTVDVSHLAGEILADLAAGEPGRAAKADIAPGLRASADPRLLRIVLENLLGNAWKFTAAASPATITVGQERTPAGPAFYIRDNGVGFDMSRAGGLFRPFQRLHEARHFPGTGIGLATARRVIRRHGGEIWASAEPGQGAVFYFTLQQTHG